MERHYRLRAKHSAALSPRAASGGSAEGNSSLAYLLDEDQFHNIESMVLAAGIHPAGTSQVIPEVMSMEDLQYKPLTKSWREGWNACRAAMLQAATLTNEDTKQAWTGIPDIDNAINMLDRIDTLESCDDDRIEAVKTVLRRLAGSFPVIPDGYVMVPVEPTKEILDEFDSIIDYGAEDSVDAWHRLLAAAPQEVNK